MPKNEVDEEVLEEGCYHLSQLGLSHDQIAGHFELTKAEVDRLVSSYASKIGSGKVVSETFDKVFWEDVKKEAEGDFKVTFVSEKGFHHAWKSELAKLDGRALMSIFESSKDFLSADPNQRFLDVPAPKGYDPLALDREVRKAVEAVGALLGEKWKESRGKEGDASPS
ncbi:MAG: hypothetical protein LYZ69_02360 [Nitrososphaerales archaeon]|nr:hypothetical protein [Nitrososphaerales archaeon]